MAPIPVFTLGVVADVQYVDKDDGFSYGGMPRYYRSSLAALTAAVEDWEAKEVDLVLQLGDIIDGYAKGRSEETLKEVMAELNKLNRPLLHVIGNHCLYNFTRQTLVQKLQINKRTPKTATNDPIAYYSLSPAPGWKLIVLDTYDLSVIGWPENHPHHIQSTAILERENCNKNKCMFGNLPLEKRRYVAFGGGVAKEQLGWLRAELQLAKQEGQLVIVAAHVPFHPETAGPAALQWNWPQVLEELHDAGNVVMTMAGHTHHNGYFQDEKGIHHIVFASALEAPKGECCHGVITVYPTHIAMQGEGYMDSREISLELAAWQN